MKKLIPALCMLLVAATLLGTSTFAWFSMNSTVSVTGMEVRAQVSNNLMIADASGLDAGVLPGDSAYYYQQVSTMHDKLIEPTSTVNGQDYFWAPVSNVKATGDTIYDTFTAYTPANRTTFNDNYGTTDAVGYVDYVSALKAVNTGDSDTYIIMNKLDLTYGDTTATGNPAFRVAVLVQEGTSATACETTPTLVAILRPSNGTYFTNLTYVVANGAAGTAGPDGDDVDTDPDYYTYSVGDTLYADTATASATTKWYSDAGLTTEITQFVTIDTAEGATSAKSTKAAAVSAANKFAEVKELDTAAVIGTVPAGQTKYFKVTVRLWLEGEDVVCNNDTFATLNDKWALDVQYTQDAATTSAVTKIEPKAKSKTDVAVGTAASSATPTLLGGKEYYSYGDYYADEAKITSATNFYTIDRNVVTDVTNQYAVYTMVTPTLSNCTATGYESTTPTKIYLTDDAVIKVKANAGYELPAALSAFQIGGVNSTAYTWDDATGTLTIEAANIDKGTVAFTIEATEIVPEP